MGKYFSDTNYYTEVRSRSSVYLSPTPGAPKAGPTWERAAGTMDDNGPTHTRTTLTNGLMGRLMWAMPVHTEHHLYPSIPFHRLPDAIPRCARGPACRSGATTAGRSASCGRCARERLGDGHRNLRTRRPDASVGGGAAGRAAALEDARHPVARARQCRALPDELRSPASGPRMADRPRRGAGSQPLVHRHPRHVRQRAVVEPVEHPDWPALVTAWDNVHAQRRLLAEMWGIERLHAVYGWSMGAQQAYHWAALFPDRVARAVINCGSARTATHNRVFLKGLMAVLEAAPEHGGGGRFSAEPAAALRAFGRIYAGLGAQPGLLPGGPPPHRARRPDLDSFLRTDWEERFARRPAADLYAQLCTWEARRHQPRPALRRRSHPGAQRDHRPAAADAGRDGSLLPRRRQRRRAAASARRRPAADPEHLGHRAGNPSINPADAAFLRDTVRAFLATAEAGAP